MSQHGLRIEKIGGTTMSRFPEVVENIILGKPETVFNRIYVVSAYGGITNELLEHKKTGKQGIYAKFAAHEDFKAALYALTDKLCDLNRSYVDAGLDLDVANQFIDERITSAINYLDSMYDVLASGYVKRQELLLAAREMLASLGEAHSAYNSANILTNRGYDATFVDLSGWHDNRELAIDERIKDAFSTIDPTKTICFTTGYTKGTEGIMREFDRGYSEVTFSKVAVLLDAEEAIIHKEYHLCSGDPMIMGEDKVHPVCNTNFDVADQLADVGMEAIHPKASKPLELAGIPIRVKNAFEPEHNGTLITKDYICKESKIEIVTGSDKVCWLEVHDTRMVGTVGFDFRIMQTLTQYGVSYISKATNANTIGMSVLHDDISKGLMSALEQDFEKVNTQDVAIVCAMGSNIAKPGVMALAAKALADASINILAVSQTTRQSNMQFIVERGHFKDAQRALHRALCE